MPMKVTVCFDRVKVIVPCGNGDFPVGDLISKAVTRYRKAIGKSNDYWVSVSYLRTVSGDGILDPDDLLNDVVDDREQLIADYEEQGGFDLPHNGDGASSSVGTSSPEMFHSGDSQTSSQQDSKESFGFHRSSKNDVIVTSSDLTIAPSLTVRHGSEPTLNTLTEQIKVNGHDCSPEHLLQESSESDSAESPKKQEQNEDSDIPDKLPFSRFARDSTRQSLGTRPEMFRWLEAQEKQQEHYNQARLERHDPVGGSSNDHDDENYNPGSDHTVGIQINPRSVIEISLEIDGSPLGIHVVPDFDESGRETGLIVQSVEKGGRVDRDGQLQVEDRIMEINGTKLLDMSFSRAQEVFRTAMKTSNLKLRVNKTGVSLPRQPPPPPPKPRGHTPVKPSPLTLASRLEAIPASPDVSPEKPNAPISNYSDTEIELPKPQPRTKSPTLIMNQPIKPGPPIKPPGSLGKKIPPAPPARHPTTALSPQVQEKAIIAPTNTRKIGKKIEIELKKGSLGLGFSVTTRDNPAGGYSPIYIKNILPKGAAISDGRLIAGDRLLEVNGIDMTDKTQAEAVTVLRNTKMGGVVIIVVSRQEAVEDKFKVPRELNSGDDQKPVLQPAEKAGDDGLLPAMSNKEILALQIPLNESGSAGLGVSVKGKTNREDGSKDLGIFIKAVIHGGAASKDGRLQINDQLLEVNDESLLGLPNTEAMDILREAMHKEATTDGFIDLKIARRISGPSPFPTQDGATMDLVGNFKPLITVINVQKIDSLNEEESSEPDDVNIRNENSGQPQEELESDFVSKDKFKNPALLRLSEQCGLRNDSYSKAVHDSFDDRTNHELENIVPPKENRYINPALARVTGPGGLHNDSYSKAVYSKPDTSFISAMQVSVKSGSVSPPSIQDTALVKDGHFVERKTAAKVRPHSAIGFLHPSRIHSQSSSSDDTDQPPVWLHGTDWDSHMNVEEEMSPFGDGDQQFIFTREGFGRQSMSEKRRGHLDPRASEFYQKAKNNRQTSLKGSSIQNSRQKHPRLVRVASAESLLSRTNTNAHTYQMHDRNTLATHPPTNLKRFNSLENLASHDDSTESEESSPRTGNKVGRGRVCNESFRAAVDRSYDPASEPIVMDTLEEESSESGSLSQGVSSARSSVSSEHATNDDHHKKLKRRVKEKKSGGILKGLFRIGKTKRSNEEVVTKQEQEREIELDDGFRDPYPQRHQAWKSAQEERERIQEHYRRLQEQQQLGQPPVYRQPEPQQHYPEWNMPAPQPLVTSATASKAEWIQQLRSKHQYQHQKRQGRYPQDDHEEYHEQVMQEEETCRGSHMPPGYPQGSRSHLPGERIYQRSNRYFDYPDPQGAPPIYEPYPSDPNMPPDYPEYYSRRPPSRGQYTDEHGLYPGEGDMIRRGTQRRTEPPPGGGYYGDPAFAYRDPMYPAVAGKRTVQTISQPGSAKV